MIFEVQVRCHQWYAITQRRGSINHVITTKKQIPSLGKFVYECLLEPTTGSAQQPSVMSLGKVAGCPEGFMYGTCQGKRIREPGQREID